MSLIAVRKLDENYDPLQGNGQGNFIYDIDAVGQIIKSTILLLLGEWWEDLTQGTPLFQSILGVPGAGRHPETIALLLQQRILSVPFVTGVANMQSGGDAQRNFGFACQVATQFGVLTVSKKPGSGATILTN